MKLNLNRKQAKHFSNLLLVSLFLFILSLNFISAVPPVTTTQQFTEGYSIQIPQDNIIQVNKDYNFDFHVFNISNGAPKTTGISCDFHLYNELGTEVYAATDSTASATGDYSFNISKGNFTKSENKYYYVRCNSSTMGGFGESILRITPSGNSGTEYVAFIIFMILAMFGIVIFGFVLKTQWIILLGSMAMIFLGVYLVQNGVIIYRDNLTLYFSYLITFLGVGLSLWAGIDWIQENM